ncbi:MAG: hypothetical protein AB7S26_40305 [Sandaracinaceae bacterium]
MFHLHESGASRREVERPRWVTGASVVLFVAITIGCRQDGFPHAGPIQQKNEIRDLNRDLPPRYFFKLKSFKAVEPVSCAQWRTTEPGEYRLIRFTTRLAVGEMGGYPCGDGIIHMEGNIFGHYFEKVLARMPDCQNCRLIRSSYVLIEEATMAVIAAPPGERYDQPSAFALYQWPIGRVGPVSIRQADILYDRPEQAHEWMPIVHPQSATLSFACPDGTFSESCVRRIDWIDQRAPEGMLHEELPEDEWDPSIRVLDSGTASDPPDSDSEPGPSSGFEGGRASEGGTLR